MKKNEQKTATIIQALELIQKAKQEIAKAMSSIVESENECHEYHESIYQSESMICSLILKLSESIGHLKAYDTANKYLD